MSSGGDDAVAPFGVMLDALLAHEFPQDGSDGRVPGRGAVADLARGAIPSLPWSTVASPYALARSQPDAARTVAVLWTCTVTKESREYGSLVESIGQISVDYRQNLKEYF